MLASQMSPLPALVSNKIYITHNKKPLGKNAKGLKMPVPFLALKGKCKNSNE
jgi:hypothetical protein